MSKITIKNSLKVFTIIMSTLLANQHSYAAESLNPATSFSKNLAFTGANILNPNVDIPITNATILISEGNIVKIQPSSVAIPANYSQINIKNKWVIPGLIDGHIHLAQTGSAFTRPDQIDATKITSYQQDQTWLNRNIGSILESYTQQGITSVFDMGGPNQYLQNYKQLPENKAYPAIYAAGTLLSPMDMPALNLNGKTFTKVATAQEAEQLVVKLNKQGSAIIKFVWTQETGLSHQQLLSLYQPAIKSAKKLGKVIAIHVDSLKDAKMAVKAGADVLLHGVMTEAIDQELIDLLKQNHVTYMPTLTAYSHYFELFKGVLTFTDIEQNNAQQYVIDSFEEIANKPADMGEMFQLISKYMPLVDSINAELNKLSAQEQSIVKQLRASFSTKFEQLQQSNLKRIIDVGINVAMGTDAGNPGTLHAVSLFGEIKAWQEANISNKKILQAMTLGNATALNIQHQIGSIFSGKHANFVVLENNPYEDMSTLTQPIMTIKRGSIINTLNEK